MAQYLLGNLTLLISLSVLCSYLGRIIPLNKLPGKILLGSIFGIITIIGMSFPYTFSPGLIFDGRSAIISIAALFFGPVTTIITSSIAIIYRIYLGGIGAWVGVSVILSSAVIGLTFFYLADSNKIKISLLTLSILGFLVHLVMFLIVMMLPQTVTNDLFLRLVLYLMLMYIPSTIILGFLLLDQRERNLNAVRLIESERNYKELFNGMQETVWIIDLDGNIIDVNDTASELLGYTRQELIKNGLFKIDSTLSKEKINSLVSTMPVEKIQKFETTHTDKYGKAIPVEIYSSLVRYNGKERILSIARDITERKVAEISLRESERRFSETLENINLISVILDTQGKISFCNDYLLELTGWQKEEVINKDWFSIFIPRDSVEIKQLFIASQTTENLPSHHENPIQTKKGELRYIRWNNTLLRDTSGKIIGLASIGEDFTEQKRTEEELKLSLDREKFLGDIVRNASLSIGVGYPNGKLGMSNKAFQTLTGYTEDELKEIDWNNVLTPPEWNDFEATQLEIIHRTKESVRYEKEYIHKDGHRIPVELVVNPFFDDKGDVSHYYAFVNDISERKKAEASLKESEAYNRMLFNQSPIGLAVTDMNGLLLDVNPAFARIIGRTIEETQQLTYWDLTPKKYTDMEHEQLKSLNETGKYGPYVKEYIHKNGQTINVRLQGLLIERKDKKYIWSSVEDITEQYIAEKTIRDSENRLAAAQARAHLGSWELSTIYDEKYWSNEMFRIFDCDPLLGVPAFDQLLDKVHPEDRGRIKLSMYGAIEKHEPYTDEYRIILKDGSIRWIEGNGAPVYDENKNMISWAGTALDITERKAAQEALRKSEELLAASVRVADIGIFDHDLRTDTVYWSETQRKIHGWGIAEPITVDQYINMLHPEDLNRINEKVKEAHDAGGTGIWSADYRVILRDGSVRWLSGRSQTFFEGKETFRKPIRTVGVVLDITERKLAEEKLKDSLSEKEVLLRELYHRTKNNMQVISSILAIQSMRTQNEEVNKILLDTQNRIRTMALVHQKLYQSQNLSSINLKEYVEELTDLLLASYEKNDTPIQVMLDIDNIVMIIDTVIPCGLIINELLSNSMKHAFPNKINGIIKISISKSDNGLVELNYKDNGIGVPEDFNFRNSESFGLQSIFSIAEQQLKGEVTFENDKGVSFKFKFRDELYSPRI